MYKAAGGWKRVHREDVNNFLRVEADGPFSAKEYRTWNGTVVAAVALAAERPQLVVTNLMVASAMLNCLWAVTEQGSVPYSEVYLDAIQNAARSRSWFRVPAGAQ